MKPSGIEWIGDIPDDWEVIKTKFLFNVYGGSTPKVNVPEYWGDKIIWITPGELGDDIKIVLNSKRMLSEKGLNSCGATLAPKGSIIISNRAPIGQVCLAGRELCTNQGCKSLVAKIKLSCLFFYYFFKVQSEVLNMLVNGTTFMELSASDLLNFKIPFPPLKTQQKIADYLDEKCGEIDATIAKQKEIIEKLKAYKQSLISETVTKGLDKSAPLKPSGIEWIGDIPDDWEVRKLLSIFKEHKDRNKNLEEQNLLSLSYGKIKRKDINNNDGLLPASFETYNIVENGDIVFRLTDLQNDKRSLRTGIVTQRGIITSAYVTIRPKIRLDSRFFHYLYHMYDICKVFYGMGDGVRQGMGFEDLKNIPTLIPPLKTQQKIADYLDSKCSQIDKYITEKQNIIQKLDAYKKSLIFECVTGKHYFI